MKSIHGENPDQPDEVIDIVNANRATEESMLRMLDALSGDLGTIRADPRWLALARTSIEQGFMFMNRALLQPSRVAITEAITIPADRVGGLPRDG